MTLEQCPGGREWMGMIWSTGTGNDYNDNDDDNELVHWYRSSETISGMTPYGLHVANKKWPLKKVFRRSKLWPSIDNLAIVYLLLTWPPLDWRSLCYQTKLLQSGGGRASNK